MKWRSRVYDVLGIIALSLAANVVLLAVVEKGGWMFTLTSMAGATMFLVSGWSFLDAVGILTVFEAIYGQKSEAFKLETPLEAYISDALRRSGNRRRLVRCIVVGVVGFWAGMLAVFVAVRLSAGPTQSSVGV